MKKKSLAERGQGGKVVGYLYNPDDREAIDFGLFAFTTMDHGQPKGATTNLIIDPCADFVENPRTSSETHSFWFYMTGLNFKGSFKERLLRSEEVLTLHKDAEAEPLRYSYSQEFDVDTLVRYIQEFVRRGCNIFVAIPTNDERNAQKLLRVLEIVGAGVGTAITGSNYLSFIQAKRTRKLDHVPILDKSPYEVTKFPPTVVRALAKGIKVHRRFTQGPLLHTMQVVESFANDFSTMFEVACQWNDKVAKKVGYNVVSPYEILDAKARVAYADQGAAFYGGDEAIRKPGFFKSEANIAYASLGTLTTGAAVITGMSGAMDTAAYFGIAALSSAVLAYLESVSKIKVRLVGGRLEIIHTKPNKRFAHSGLDSNGYPLELDAADARSRTMPSKVTESTVVEDWTEAWNQVFDRHSKIISQWLEYEMDLFLSLSYPLMIDSSVPETATLNRAIVVAGDLKSQVNTSVNPVGTDYYNAVQELALAFDVAEKNAHKVGQTIWTREERKKVRTGQQLLNVATNQGASTDERATAFKRVLSTVEGIAVLPTKGREKLSASIGLIER